MAAEQNTRIRLFPAVIPLYRSQFTGPCIKPDLPCCPATPENTDWIPSFREAAHAHRSLGSGRRIPADQLEIVFQGSISWVTRSGTDTGGLGLGLAIAKRMADLLKLKIEGSFEAW